MGVLASLNAANAASERASSPIRCEIKSKTAKRQRRQIIPEVKVENRLVYKHQIPVFERTGEKFGLAACCKSSIFNVIYLK